MATPANSLCLHTAEKQSFLPWREETWGQACSSIESRASQQKSSCEIACLHPICLSNLRWHWYQLTRSSINVVSYFTQNLKFKYYCKKVYSEEVMTVWLLLVSKYRETKPPPPKTSLFSRNDSGSRALSCSDFFWVIFHDWYENVSRGACTETIETTKLIEDYSILSISSPIPHPRVVGRLLPGRGEPLKNKATYVSFMFRDFSEDVFFARCTVHRYQSISRRFSQNN